MADNSFHSDFLRQMVCLIYNPIYSHDLGFINEKDRAVFAT